MKEIRLSGAGKSMFALASSLLLIVSLFLPNLTSQTDDVVHAEEDNIVLGYYASWAPPEDLDPTKVTHMNYSFADVCWEGEHGNPHNEEIEDGEDKVWACEDLDGNEQDDIADGTIVLYESEVDLVELENLENLKSENPDLKTLVSVGGWTLSNNLSLVAADEGAREAFAQSAVDFVRAFNMDGLDLDWEYPNDDGHPGNNLGPEDTENHTKILQAVRDAFDQAEQEDDKEYLVTIAGAANNAYKDNNELDKIADIVDYMAVMAYDINGTWRGVTGHNAPLYGSPLEEDIIGWTNGHSEFAINSVYEEVPNEKLVLGLAFYGQAWGGCNVEDDGAFNINNGAYQTCGTAGEAVPSLESTDYDYIKSIVNKDGYHYYFDNVSKVPYLYNEEKGEFVSYDNVESLGYKVNFIKDEGLGGAMIWDLGTDDKDYNLLKTVSHGLGVSSEEPEPDPEQPGEIDVEEFEALIEEAENITNDDNKYTDDSYQGLQAAIADAEAALGTIHSEETLNSAMADLQAAIDGLEDVDDDPEEIDTTELKALIEEAENSTNDDNKYTDDSYQGLQNAIVEAKAALGTIHSEEMLNSAMADLQAAIDGLEDVDDDPKETEIDTTELKALIEEAENSTNDDNKYTDDSYQGLQNAIVESKAALETIDSEETLNSAIADLQAAIDGLEDVDDDPEEIDTTELKALIEEAENNTNDDDKYTDESYQGLQNAIVEAKAALKTIDSEEALHATLASLQSAIDELDVVKVENDENDENDKSAEIGEKLPKTATPMHNIMLVGFILLALGATTFIVMNRRKNKNKKELTEHK